MASHNKAKGGFVFRALSVLFLIVIMTMPAYAYTGSFGVSPTAIGPDKKTEDKFDIDTETTNPQEIMTDLFYVYKIIIETASGQTGPLHIKEYETGEDPAFDIILPKPINDDLVKATIYIWGPDDPTLTIYHYHTGEPTYTIEATKVEPTVTREDGMVLWYFETTSFSSFFINKPRPIRQFPLIPVILLAILSAAPCIVLRRH